MGCVNSGFQILYAIDQFSSPFSKDKLKQATHIHQTHDPPCMIPMIRLPACVVWSWHSKDSPRQERVFYTRVFLRFPSLCIAATFEACVFPCGLRLLFVRGFGVFLLLGSLINLDTLGKWSSPPIRFVTPSSGLNFLVSFFSFFLSLLLTFCSLL